MNSWRLCRSYSRAIYWEGYIIATIVIGNTTLISCTLPVLKIPNRISIAICIWIQLIICIVPCWILNWSSIWFIHYWRNRWCCQSSWSWKSIQLSRNCRCTINGCVSIETCRLQGFHHVIYWLVQAWSLLSIWWSILTRIGRSFFCWQFSLNFCNSLFDSSFLFCILMIGSIFFCYLIQ